MTRLADDLGYMIDNQRMYDICDWCPYKKQDEVYEICLNEKESFCPISVLWNHRQEMADCLMKLSFIKEHEVIREFFCKGGHEK